MRMYFARSILLVLLVIGAGHIVRGQNNVEIFDNYAEAASRTSNVPCMSIVVARDGRVLLPTGDGVREL